MSTVAPPVPKKHVPYVPETMEMKEFTFRAVLIGLVMTAVLGAANAYLGLKAGMTIAATYPAAVIGMALLRLMKGTLLEENIARTVGSIGESVAAGAVFTIPAFVMAGLWPGLTRAKYWNSVALMMIGGTLGLKGVGPIGTVGIGTAAGPPVTAPNVAPQAMSLRMPRAISALFGPTLALFIFSPF